MTNEMDNQPPKCTNAPARIYLIVGDIERDCLFGECNEVTWCTEKQYDADIAYVREPTEALAGAAHEPSAVSDVSPINVSVIDGLEHLLRLAQPPMTEQQALASLTDLGAEVWGTHCQAEGQREWLDYEGFIAAVGEIEARAATPPPEALRQLVAQQAEDDGLWFDAKTAPEAYLQQELRKLHAAIEGNEIEFKRPAQPAPAEPGSWYEAAMEKIGTLESEITALRASQPPVGDCICKGTWRAIVKAAEPLIGKEFRNTAGNTYRFFGVVHGEDDYYYGMADKNSVRLLSCVGSIEDHGYKLCSSQTKEAGQ